MNLFENKKGQWSTFQKFIVAAAIIVILLFIARGQLFGADKQLSTIRIAAVNDFDGDGTKDNMDEAPCTFGDMKVLQKGDKDVFYPVQRPISNQGVSGAVLCPEKEGATEKLTCTGQTYEGLELQCVMDRESGEQYCALTQTACDELLKAEYERIKAQSK